MLKLNEIVYLNVLASTKSLFSKEFKKPKIENYALPFHLLYRSPGTNYNYICFFLPLLWKISSLIGCDFCRFHIRFRIKSQNKPKCTGVISLVLKTSKIRNDRDIRKHCAVFVLHGWICRYSKRKEAILVREQKRCLLLLFFI